MNPFKRVSLHAMVLACLGICILFSGCAAVQLTSVPQSEPHGTLTVSREEKWDLGFDYKSISVKVDDKYVFNEIEGKSATFRLAPGKHEVEAEYSRQTGSGYNVIYYKQSPVLYGVVEVKEKKPHPSVCSATGKRLA